MYGFDVDELALLSLQESYSLPILMYAVPALSLQSKQLDELNVCWNNVVRKLFHYNIWESVKSVLFNLSRLNVTHLVMILLLLLVWHAPLGVRSAKRRHQSPEWTILSHSYRLIQ